MQGSSPIYAISFSHDESFLLYSCDKNLFIKPVAKGGLKTLSWKAHDGIVLCAEWCPVNKLIVSGGEDCKYKVILLINRFGINMVETYLFLHLMIM